MAPSRALTAGEIVDLVDGELIGSANTTITGVASLEEAGPGDLAFLASSTYLRYFRATRAGAVLMGEQFRALNTGPATRIVVTDPRAAVQQIADHMREATEPAWAIHPTATVGRGTRWCGRIALATGASIGADVQFGESCRVGDYAHVGDGTICGAGCVIGAYAYVEPHTTLGDRVVLKTGARVGMPGFAFRRHRDAHERLGHPGTCRIEDDVEIGANTTIDRGSIGATVIGPGTKIDNLVQIAHNVRIGARCLILAQAGIAGTTTIGNDVIIAGQAGLAGHLSVGDGARVAAQAGVIGDVPTGSTVSGYPARPHRAVLRQTAALRRLTSVVGPLERLARESQRD